MDIELQTNGVLADETTPIIYLIDDREHPLPIERALASAPDIVIARVFVSNWEQNLTPWSAPSLFKEAPDFGDGAQATFKQLCAAIPVFEEHLGRAPLTRALAGYSLGGLFSLYALTCSCNSQAPLPALFNAYASMSGSLWYDGWIERLDTFASSANGQEVLSGMPIYLSVGAKEKRAARKRLKRVEDRTRKTEEILRSAGAEVECVIGTGGHLSHIPERIERCVTWLAEHLT